MPVSTSIDYRRGPSLEPADLLELYRERPPEGPLLLRARAAAAKATPPGPELPLAPKERRDAIFELVYRGHHADAEAIVAGWIDAAAAGDGEAAALELIDGLEALSILCEQRGDAGDAASALAAALRLHARRSSLPFHGILLRRSAVILSCLGGLSAGRLLASEALRLAIETGDSSGAAYSLAVAQRMASLAHDWPAVLSSAAAMRRYLPESEELLRFASLKTEAGALLHLGRIEEAEATLAAATAALAGRETPLTESYLLWARARLRQVQGRHQEAAADFEKAGQLGRDTQEPVNRFLILLHAEESLEALGRRAELAERCRQLDRELPDLERRGGAGAIAAAGEGLRGRLA